MSAVTPIRYLEVQLSESEKAGELLVRQFASAGMAVEEARELVKRHRSDSAARLRSENASIVDEPQDDRALHLAGA